MTRDSRNGLILFGAVVAIVLYALGFLSATILVSETSYNRGQADFIRAYTSRLETPTYQDAYAMCYQTTVLNSMLHTIEDQNG